MTDLGFTMADVDHKKPRKTMTNKNTFFNINFIQ